MGGGVCAAADRRHQPRHPRVPCAHPQQTGACVRLLVPSSECAWEEGGEDEDALSLPPLHGSLTPLLLLLPRPLPPTCCVQDMRPCQAVRIDEMGHKMGCNGVDNGKLWFDREHRRCRWFPQARSWPPAVGYSLLAAPDAFWPGSQHLLLRRPSVGSPPCSHPPPTCLALPLLRPRPAPPPPPPPV